MPESSPVHVALIAKLSALPAERLAEVEDVVEFLRSRELDSALAAAALAGSAPAFAAVWDNTDDDVYPDL